MAIFVDIMVPANLMSLCCKYTGKPSNTPHYQLDKTDPQRLQELIDIIKKAHPNQFHVRYDRETNRATAKTLAQYNKLHPEAPLDIIDLIKMVDVSNYKWTSLGTSGKDKGLEMHEFGGIKIGDFARNSKTAMYIKFVTPDSPSADIDVVSAHRSCDRYEKYSNYEPKRS